MYLERWLFYKQHIFRSWKFHVSTLRSIKFKIRPAVSEFTNFRSTFYYSNLPEVQKKNGAWKESKLAAWQADLFFCQHFVKCSFEHPMLRANAVKEQSFYFFMMILSAFHTICCTIEASNPDRSISAGKRQCEFFVYAFTRVCVCVMTRLGNFCQSDVQYTYV